MLAKFRTYHLALELHKNCKPLRLPTHLKDQFERAVSSICLNLAEGSAKPTEKDRKRYYAIALGSCREAQTVIEMESLANVRELADRLAANLYKLTRS